MRGEHGYVTYGGKTEAILLDQFNVCEHGLVFRVVSEAASEKGEELSFG